MNRNTLWNNLLPIMFVVTICVLAIPPILDAIAPKQPVQVVCVDNRLLVLYSNGRTVEAKDMQMRKISCTATSWLTEKELAND